MGTSSKLLGSHRGLKICCGVTTLLLIIIAATFAILYLTIFKPKEPEISTQSATLENFSVMVFPSIDFNATLRIVVGVNNRNYGSFKFENSTSYISYRENVIAEAPIEADTVPARGKLNITTTVVLLAGKIVAMPDFKTDYDNGVFNFSSQSTLHGKVKVMKMIKLIDSRFDKSQFMYTLDYFDKSQFMYTLD
ncbi:late embryogenesis abundant protein At1g64065-like [Tripterygium wilfordii]|uniref:late embryogenesis abundant protein At1g64065-like n=1 Tax=Tripterygium wilfordii TaxID=458696 RepID=UPI0018F7EBA0|nr:late embryogenesis abundant protein At1g64065-like [Tripterygium wilfordii]